MVRLLEGDRENERNKKGNEKLVRRDEFKNRKLKL